MTRLRPMRSGVALLAAAVLLSIPAAADAASVSSRNNAGTTSIEFVAGPGEVNIVTVQPGAVAGEYAITDSGGAALTTGTGCSVTGAGAATCQVNSLDEVLAQLGDGNDRLTSTLILAIQGHGGDGNDVFITGTGSDTLFGEGGDDTLDGGLGLDYLSGDLGHDIVSYASRTAPVAAGPG